MQLASALAAPASSTVARHHRRIASPRGRPRAGRPPRAMLPGPVGRRKRAPGAASRKSRPGSAAWTVLPSPIDVVAARRWSAEARRAKEDQARRDPRRPPDRRACRGPRCARPRQRLAATGCSAPRCYEQGCGAGLLAGGTPAGVRHGGFPTLPPAALRAPARCVGVARRGCGDERAGRPRLDDDRQRRRRPRASGAPGAGRAGTPALRRPGARRAADRAAGPRGRAGARGVRRGRAALPRRRRGRDGVRGAERDLPENGRARRPRGVGAAAAAGTGNSFLRDFDVCDLEGAHAALLRDCRRRGRRDPRGAPGLCELYYLNLLSIGFSAEVGALTNRRFKRLGHAGYGLAVVLRVAGLRHPAFRVREDGGPVDDLALHAAQLQQQPVHRRDDDDGPARRGRRRTAAGGPRGAPGPLGPAARLPQDLQEGTHRAARGRR
ncbi:MAG: hypothetical protein MZV63_06160 [Marinilabiliales bacterium]|nr:hypothetical protein [Marinilabiliales bacterium]